MKKIYVYLISMMAIISLHAQSPEKMSYQAVIRSSSDQLVKNQPVGMRVSILQGSITGTEVYKEIYNPNPQTNANGLVTVEIGGGIPITGIFASIDWSDGTYFIKTETDPTGGTNYTITGTSQLLSVPYALYSKTAGSTSGHYLGELFGGGIVIAIWKAEGSEHGLIASLTDISTGSMWSNVTAIGIGQDARNPYYGQTNTNAIVVQNGHTDSAAKLCDDYTADGYSDWYLPASWELNHCYNNAFIINTILGPTNGFQFDYYYWSSTEYNGTSAWSHSSGQGTAYQLENKSNTYRVRAVRRF